MALDHSSLRWFEACSCKPAPRGLALILHAASWRTVSNAEELPLYVLSEPGVNLSAHRAPITQPRV